MEETVGYNVQALLKVVGASQFHGDMARGADGASKLGSSLKGAWAGARQLGGGLFDLAEKAAGALLKVAGLGAAVASVGVGQGVLAIGKNLRSLEDQSIKLGAVIAAATETPFDKAREASQQLFDQFRADAVESAGGTKDFVDVAGKIAGAVLGAGKSMAELHELTKGVIDTAPALGVKFEQAGSDVMRMLQGNAGADLPFFQALKSIPSLGIESAEAFNKLSSDKRIEKVQTALTNPAFRDAAKLAGSSVTGLLSTLEDLGSTTGGIVLGPVFEKGKQKLAAFNDAVIKGLSEGRLRTKLSAVGSELAFGFERAERQLSRIFPSLDRGLGGTADLLLTITRGGMDRLVAGVGWVADRWPAITAGARTFAGVISDAADRAADLLRALGGGDMGKGLERAAMLYGGAKVGGALSPAASGALTMGQGLLGAGRALLGSGGAAAGAAEAGAGAAGAAGAASGLAVASLAAVVAMAAIGNAAIMARAGFLDLDGTFDRVRSRVSILAAGASELWGKLGNLWDALGRVYRAVEPVIGLLALLNPLFSGLGRALMLLGELVPAGIDLLASVTFGLTGVVDSLTGAFNKLSLELGSLLSKVMNTLGIARKLDAPDQDQKRFYDAPIIVSPMSGSVAARIAGGASGLSTKPPKPQAQKVEVTIKWDLGDGNEDAIIVRTRRDIVRALEQAKAQGRAQRLRMGGI